MLQQLSKPARSYTDTDIELLLDRAERATSVRNSHIAADELALICLELLREMRDSKPSELELRNENLVRVNDILARSYEARGVANADLARRVEFEQAANKKLVQRIEELLAERPQYTPLDTYLDQPHARNDTGKRNMGDLSYDEIGTLDRKDLWMAATVLRGAMHLAEVEAARWKMNYYCAKRDEFSALHRNGERDYKLAQMRNSGTNCDAEP